MPITFTQAARQIRALGFKVTRDSYGEIRVAWPGNESAAFYTDDPADACGTAELMAREMAPAPDHEGLAVETGEHEPGEVFDAADAPSAAALLPLAKPDSEMLALAASVPPTSREESAAILARMRADRDSGLLDELESALDELTREAAANDRKAARPAVAMVRAARIHALDSFRGRH